MPIREREHASCEAQWLAAEEDAAGTPGTSQMGRCYPCSEVTAEGTEPLPATQSQRPLRGNILTPVSSLACLCPVSPNYPFPILIFFLHSSIFCLDSVLITVFVA